jgi:biotin synthase
MKKSQVSGEDVKVGQGVMTREDIVELLRLRGADQQTLFAEARAVREQHFGTDAVVRGVIEIGSVCVQNCTYCPMRRDNSMMRYLLDSESIVEAASHVRSAGILVVSLQAGDAHPTTETAGKAIPAIREMFGGQVDVLLVLGDKPRKDYAYLRDQGATSYILKFETSSERLHKEHRRYGLTQRLALLRDLLDLGYRVGTGTIVGLPGQTIEILADDLLLAKSLGIHMSSASPFVPAPGTPLSDDNAGDIDLTLNAIAVTRLLLPNALIPSVSALEKQLAGAQLAGLNAGANVITVNFTPERDRRNYPIYGPDRFIVRQAHAEQTLKQSGLRPSATLP